MKLYLNVIIIYNIKDKAEFEKHKEEQDNKRTKSLQTKQVDWRGASHLRLENIYVKIDYFPNFWTRIVRMSSTRRKLNANYANDLKLLLSWEEDSSKRNRISTSIFSFIII